MTDPYRWIDPWEETQKQYEEGFKAGYDRAFERFAPNYERHSPVKPKPTYTEEDWP